MGVTPQSGGLAPAMGQAQWVVTARTGLGVCGGTARERACLGVGPGPRGAPAITQLLHLGGVTRPWAGLPLPAGQAPPAVTGHTGLGMCGSLTRKRAGARVAPVLGGAPAITQLFHLDEGDPPSAEPALPTGWAQWVVPARAGLDVCGSPTRERAGVWVAAGPRATPVITQLLPRGGGDPRLGVLVLPAGQAQ